MKKLLHELRGEISDLKAQGKETRDQIASSSRGPSGKDQLGVETLLSRLDRHAKILEADREKKDAPEKTRPKGETRSAGATSMDNEFVKELQSANVNPREWIMRKLCFFTAVVTFVLPKGMKERVTPKKLVQIAKTGLSVLQYYSRWLTEKTLLKSSIASEVKLVSKTADSLLEGPNENCVNEYPLELLMRRLYAFEQAFQDVHVESDWRAPRGEQAKRWKSKVRWGVLDSLDLYALEADISSIPEVDAEAHEVAQTQQRYASYTTALSTNAPGNTNSFPRAITSTDDD